MARVEAILANLAAASAEISGAHDSTEARIAALRRSAAELGDELTRLHGDQAQAEQALAHHVQGVTRYEQQEQQLLEESLHHRDRAQAADLHWHSVLERSRSLEEIVRSAQGRISELAPRAARNHGARRKRPRCAGRRPRAARFGRANPERSLLHGGCRAETICVESGRRTIRRASAPSACWPITPKSNSSTKARSNNFCAMNSNTSSSKHSTWRARASRCFATKSADARRSSWIRCAS